MTPRNSRARPCTRVPGVALAMMLVATTASVAETAFISSEPFGATIELDGIELDTRTPAVLDLEPGTYTVALSRDGHTQEGGVLTVPADGFAEFRRVLPAQYVLLDADEERPPERFDVPVGRYEIERRDGTIEIEPIYPRERRLTTVRTLIPVSLGVGVAFVAWGAIAPPENPRLAVVPGAVAQFTAGIMGVWAGVLATDRSRYLRAWAPPERPHLPVTASNLLEQAKELLELGDIHRATEHFTELVTAHPGASGVPEALYTLGRLAAVDGRDDVAAQRLRRLVRDYPTRHYYDRALLLLARLAATNGAPDEAMAYLESITYADEGVTPEAVEAVRDLVAR